MAPVGTENGHRILSPKACLLQQPVYIKSRYNSNATTRAPRCTDSLQLHTTHIEGAFGNDEGAKASEGGDLGITPLDDIEQRLEPVHDLDCFAFKEIDQYEK